MLPPGVAGKHFVFMLCVWVRGVGEKIAALWLLKHCGCLKAQELSTPSICFLPSEQGEQHKDRLQKLHQRVAARALLPAALSVNLSTYPAPRALVSVQQVALFPPRSNEIHCSAHRCFVGMKLGFSIIGSFIF